MNVFNIPPIQVKQNKEHPNVMVFTVLPETQDTVDLKISDKIGKKLKGFKFYLDVKKNPSTIDLIQNLPNKKTTTLTVPAIEYTITVKVPQIIYKRDGIEYLHVATIKKELELDMVQVFATDNTKNISKYNNVSYFRCDHCGYNRKRKTCHVFADSKGNEIVVASTCSKEYFGIDVDNLLKKLLWVIDIDGMVRKLGDGFRGLPHDKYWNWELYAKIVYGLIHKEKNFVSRKNATSERSSTADRAWSLMNYEDYDELTFVLKIANSFSINEIIDYWESRKKKNPNDNFVNNAFTALHMTNPQSGLIAYAVFEYIKEKEDVLNKKTFDISKSKHQGTIGQRETFKNLTVYDIIGFSGAYGWTNIIKFVDKDNNCFTWFNTGKNSVEKNKSYNVTGTVKKHDLYKGIATTILNRCSIEDITQ